MPTLRAHGNWVGSIIILLFDGGEQPPQSHLNKHILVQVGILSTLPDQGWKQKIGEKPPPIET